MADNIMDALNQAYENETDVCIINPDTRTIDVPSKWRFLGVTSDEKSKRVPFKCPRYVDDIDLMDYSLYINYENADGTKDAHHITDVTLDGDFITFTWLLSRQVTAYKGDVHYILCAKIVEDTEIINEWNTVPAVGTVSEGLEATSQIVDRDEDVIEQILIEIGNIPKSIHLTASQIIESTETSFKVELTPEQRTIFDTETTFKVYTGDMYPDEVFWYFIKESGFIDNIKRFFSVTNGALTGIYTIEDYDSYVWFKSHGRLIYQNEIVDKIPNNGDMLKIEEDRLSKAIPGEDYIAPKVIESDDDPVVVNIKDLTTGVYSVKSNSSHEIVVRYNDYPGGTVSIIENSIIVFVNTVKGFQNSQSGFRYDVNHFIIKLESGVRSYQGDTRVPIGQGWPSEGSIREYAQARRFEIPVVYRSGGWQKLEGTFAEIKRAKDNNIEPFVLVGRTQTMMTSGLECRFIKASNTEIVFSGTAVYDDEIELVSITINSDESVEYAEKIISNNSVILNSSTPGSTKQFKLTIDDSGAITTAEVV